jgi:hypothetical protein
MQYAIKLSVALLIIEFCDSNNKNKEGNEGKQK